MTRIASSLAGILALVLAVLGGIALAQQDKYTLKVPGGLAFSEFRGYEDWPVIAISENGGLIAAILGNTVMIDAYKKGVPGNGERFPDGAKMAKIHWNPKKQETYPGRPTVPGIQHDVNFMVKDSKRFGDSGRWGWAAFDYDATSGTFRPSTVASHPPQENDAKCGFACHTVVKNRDYVRKQVRISTPNPGIAAFKHWIGTEVRCSQRGSVAIHPLRTMRTTTGR